MKKSTRDRLISKIGRFSISLGNICLFSKGTRPGHSVYKSDSRHTHATPCGNGQAKSETERHWIKTIESIDSDGHCLPDQCGGQSGSKKKHRKIPKNDRVNFI